MRPARASRRLAAAAVAAVLGLSGCGLTHIHDLNFRVDKRLHFVSPKSRSTVTQPVTVSWTMSDFQIAAEDSQPPSRDAGYFAIFVDQAPIKPGATMKSVADGDAACQSDPKCPNRAYLSEHDVFTTTKTSIRLPQIPDLTNSKQTLQVHTITIVLMDTSGHRIGESAWELDVRIHKASY
ncbi:MAG TPA: hypothetical protein VG899_15390 [Mycobacteriales bacterium]|nr:hypothetical protein [Mycobacteriales bacterium]